LISDRWIYDKMATNQMPNEPEVVSTLSSSEQQMNFGALREQLMGERRPNKDRILVPVTLGSGPMPSYQEQAIQSAFESCAFKTIFSGVVGFGLGGAIGLFSASVGPDLAVLDSEKQNWREVLRDMKTKSLSHAKNFGILGAMFACTECAIESVFESQFDHFPIPLSHFNSHSLDTSPFNSIEPRAIGRTELWPAELPAD
jgi:hypothetical protein